MSDNGRQPQRGFFRVPNEAHERAVELSGTAVKVLLSLAKWGDKSGYVETTVARLARQWNLHERNIYRGLEQLVSASIIEVVRRNSAKGAQLTNGYRVLYLSPRQPGDGIDTLPWQICQGGGGGNVTPYPEDLLNIQTLSEPTEARAGQAGTPATVPPGLLVLIDAWNALPEGTVATGNRAKRDPPSKAVLSGWNRAHKNPDQRDAFQDVPAIIEVIKCATFCHGQGWFTLPWLFGKNKNGEFNVSRLLAGAYVGDHQNGNHDRRRLRGSAGPGGCRGEEAGRIRTGKALPITILSNEDPPGGAEAADASLDG